MRWAVLVGGQGTNLEALLRAGLSVDLVVSHRAGVRALAVAETHRVESQVLLPRAFPDRDSYGRALVSIFRERGIEAVALAGFMRWLDPGTVDAYRGRIFNVHPSLLPAFRGLNAVGQALAYGVAWTGVTVHLVDEGEDTGPIVAQEPVRVLDSDDEETLAARIHAVEHRLYPETLVAFEQGAFHLDGRRVRWHRKAD